MASRKSACSPRPRSSCGTGRTCWTRSRRRWRGRRALRRIRHYMWILAVILIVALMIPVAAILVDSPLGRSVARRLEGRGEGGGSGGGGASPELRVLRREVEGREVELEALDRFLAGNR